MKLIKYLLYLTKNINKIPDMKPIENINNKILNTIIIDTMIGGVLSSEEIERNIQESAAQIERARINQEKREEELLRAEQLVNDIVYAIRRVIELANSRDLTNIVSQLKELESLIRQYKITSVSIPT